MYDNERQNKILEILKQEKRVSVDKLVKMLYVSQATVRRDLEAMSKKGLLKRTHGGAILFSSSNEESSLFIREETMKKEKREIAEKCVELLKSNLSIFIDASSTVSNIIPLLTQFQYLTLITNGLSTALLIDKKTEFKVFVPGGFVHNQSNSILGDVAVRTIGELYCDVFIFSCAGIDIKQGITEASLEQSEIKKTMMKNAKTKILLADSSKFGKVFLSRLCDCSSQSIDVIITDKGIDQKYIDQIHEIGIKLIY
jgi:DeoR/GlpR family transcriptional regulator of sugar metabolism